MKQDFINSILESIQNLEEIAGPDTRAEYIDILEAVKVEIDKRLNSAREIQVYELCSVIHEYMHKDNSSEGREFIKGMQALNDVGADIVEGPKGLILSYPWKKSIHAHNLKKD